MPTDLGQRDRRFELLVLVQSDPETRQPAGLLTRAPGVASAGNPVDRCWLSGAGSHADPDDGFLATVVMDHNVAGLYQGHHGVAGRSYASACCRRSLKIHADIIAAGYLHPHVLTSITLSPVHRPLIWGTGNRRPGSDEEPGVMRISPLSQALAFEVLDNIRAKARQHPIYRLPEHLAPPLIEPSTEYQPVRRLTGCCVRKRILIAPISQFR